MGDQLGVGSSQPQMPFGDSDESLLEVLTGNVIARSYNPQRALVSEIAETIAAPLLAAVRSPYDSHCRNVQSRVDLNCRF